MQQILKLDISLHWPKKYFMLLNKKSSRENNSWLNKHNQFVINLFFMHNELNIFFLL